MKYIILLVFPLISFASIDITEIMYDPAGTDSGREWIEIYNKGSDDIDLNTWKVLENEVEHKIVGESDIKAGEYGVIADNIDKFKLDYPTYTGLIFDSVFSLRNTGESIGILDGEGNQYAYVEYDVSLGGKDGNTLSLIGGVYVNGVASPGIENSSSNEVVEETTTTETESTHSSPKKLSDEKKKVKLKIGAGRDRVVTVNTPVKFEVVLNTSVSDRRIRWNFGDGHAKSRKKVSHSYEFPGIYNVVVRGKDDGDEAISRTTVTVYIPEISISEVNTDKGYVVIENAGDMEVNLGGYKIKGSDLSFRFPKDTILRAHTPLYLSYSTLWYTSAGNLSVGNVWVEYPEGGRVENN